MATVIRFDESGHELSDRDVTDFSLGVLRVPAAAAEDGACQIKAHADVIVGSQAKHSVRAFLETLLARSALD